MTAIAAAPAAAVANLRAKRDRSDQRKTACSAVVVGGTTKDTLFEVWPTPPPRYHAFVVEAAVQMLGVTLGFGHPWVAAFVIFGAGFDRLLRMSERRGWAFPRRNWTTTGVGNALLQLHVALEPQRARIETQLAMEQLEPGGRVGSDGPDGPVCRLGGPDNVIDIDFVRRRRRC